MEVIDILGYDVDVVVFLKLDKGEMGGVGTRADELAAAFVVETVDQSGIAAETVGRGHLHDGIILPESVGVAECLYARFGTDPGTC